MRWAVTFGQRYRTEDHPTFLPAHPDGYVVIDVPSREYLPPRLAAMPGNVEEIAAREAAFELMGSQWSMMYPMSEMDAMQLDGIDTGGMYPRGQIGLIERVHGHWVFVEPHAAYQDTPDGPPEEHQCWCRIREAHHVNDPEPHPFESDLTPGVAPGNRCRTCGQRPGASAHYGAAQVHLTEAQQAASRARWLAGPLTDPPYGEGP